MTGDTNDNRFLKKALRGVRTIICPNVCIAFHASLYIVISVTVRKKAKIHETTFGQQLFLDLFLSFKQFSEEVELYHSFPGGFSIRSCEPSRGKTCDPLIAGTFLLFSSYIAWHTKTTLGLF